MIDLNEIKNTVINDFSDEYLKKIPSDSIDMIITSPPYDDLRDYEGKINWNFDVFKVIAEEMYRIMKKGGVAVWVVGDKTKNGNKTLTSFRQGLYFQEIGFNMYDVIIYEKKGTGPPHPNRYFNAFEYMFVLSKGKPKTVNLLRDKKNIWEYSNGKKFSTKDEIAYKHPAIFPEKLVEDHILSWSNPGDLILDPFGGSGTTGKVAKKLDRDWILIEAVKDYCIIAEKRIEGTGK